LDPQHLTGGDEKVGYMCIFFSPERSLTANLSGEIAQKIMMERSLEKTMIFIVIQN
jgi:hypothetical protein